MKGRKTGYLYILSVATFALLIWGTILSIRQPYTGVFWEYSTGIVYQVDDSHPSAYQVHKGDQVISGEAFGVQRQRAVHPEPGGYEAAGA